MFHTALRSQCKDGRSQRCSQRDSAEGGWRGAYKLSLDTNVVTCNRCQVSPIILFVLLRLFYFRPCFGCTVLFFSLSELTPTSPSLQYLFCFFVYLSTLHQTSSKRNWTKSFLRFADVIAVACHSLAKSVTCSGVVGAASRRRPGMVFSAPSKNCRNYKTSLTPCSEPAGLLYVLNSSVLRKCYVKNANLSCPLL